ncbi:MAG: TSUP family transporter [Oscillospiraceae bacterium]|jgi:uncharacterized membrane protein YfcA
MVLAALVGFFTGVLSGFGVGGGTLLMIYLVSFAGVGQAAAQGINLIYFLPCSAAALVSHIKNGLVDKKVALPAIVAGAVSTLAASLLATAIETTLLEKIFGVFLLAVGASELFRK